MMSALVAIFMTTVSCKAKRSMLAADTTSVFINAQVSAFDRIETDIPMELILAQGKETKVEYSDPKGIVKRVVVENRVLRIEADDKILRSVHNANVRFHIVTPDLKNVFTNAPLSVKMEKMRLDNLNLKVNGPIRAEIRELACKNLVCTFNGPSSVHGDIKGDDVSITYNGPATTSLDVAADECVLVLNGPAKADVTYKGNDAAIRLNGPGSVSMNVDCDKLSAICNDVGSIKVKGTANQSEVNINGTGSVDTSWLNKL